MEIDFKTLHLLDFERDIFRRHTVRKSNMAALAKRCGSIGVVLVLLLIMIFKIERGSVCTCLCACVVLRRFQQSLCHITIVAACGIRRDSARVLCAANTDAPCHRHKTR